MVACSVWMDALAFVNWWARAPAAFQHLGAVALQKGRTKCQLKEFAWHIGPRANGSRPGALVRTQGYPNVREESLR